MCSPKCVGGIKETRWKKKKNSTFKHLPIQHTHTHTLYPQLYNLVKQLYFESENLVLNLCTLSLAQANHSPSLSFSFLMGRTLILQCHCLSCRLNKGMKSMLRKANHDENDSCHFKSVAISSYALCNLYSRAAKLKKCGNVQTSL